MLRLYAGGNDVWDLFNSKIPWVSNPLRRAWISRATFWETLPSPSRSTVVENKILRLTVQFQSNWMHIHKVSPYSSQIEIAVTIVMDLFNNCLWNFFTYFFFKATINSHPGISSEICFHTLLSDPCEINHVEGFFFFSPLMSYLPGGKILNFPFLLNAHSNKVFFEKS